MAQPPESPAGRRTGMEAGVLAALLLLAFVLRRWVAAAIPVIETDGVQYVRIAEQFRASGIPWDPLFHPLYSVAIALTTPLGADLEAAGRLVSATLRHSTDPSRLRAGQGHPGTRPPLWSPLDFFPSTPPSSSAGRRCSLRRSIPSGSPWRYGSPIEPSPLNVPGRSRPPGLRWDWVTSFAPRRSCTSSDSWDGWSTTGFERPRSGGFCVP